MALHYRKQGGVWIVSGLSLIYNRQAGVWRVQNLGIFIKDGGVWKQNL